MDQKLTNEQIKKFSSKIDELIEKLRAAKPIWTIVSIGNRHIVHNINIGYKSSPYVYGTYGEAEKKLGQLKNNS